MSIVGSIATEGDKVSVISDDASGFINVKLTNTVQS